MATIKLVLPVALLLCGLVAIGSSVQRSEAKEGRVCPMYCLNTTYMTCKSTGDERLQAVCNCCLVDRKGCTIHLANGQNMTCP